MTDQRRPPTDAVKLAIDALVARAVAAQLPFAGWAEERVDALLADIATTVAERAEHLAAATVAETGIGKVLDKTRQNRVVCRAVYQSLAGKPGTGRLRVDAARGVAALASPVGVVLGLLPATNPVATFVVTT